MQCVLGNFESSFEFHMRAIIHNWCHFLFIGNFLTIVLGCSVSVPRSIGEFAPCPNTPNCVSTKSILNKHKIDPILYEGGMEEVKKRLLATLMEVPRNEVKIERKKFLHVEFTSKMMRFVDDVEFYLDEPGVIHFRSASRIGHSDYGVNRERMETIRQRLFATR